MAQHSASTQKVLRSALKHKNAADTLLNLMNGMTSAIAAARAKIAADANATWDTNYVSTVGVSYKDLDSSNVGQNKSSLRRILRGALAHKRLADDLCDVLEEAQVTHNLIMAQMDADAGTLSNDATYDAFAISSLLDIDAKSYGQNKASFKKSLQVALSHKSLGTSLAQQISAIQTSINSMISEIKAKN